MFFNPDLLGAIVAIFAALFLSIGILSVRKATVTDDPLIGVFPIALIGFFIYLPLTLIFHQLNFELTIKSLIVFSAGGLLSTFLARASYYKGAERVGASWSAPIKNASMVVSTVIGIALLHETVTFGHITGIGLIAAGVIILGYKIGSHEGSSSFTDKSSYLNLAFPMGAMLFFGIADPLIDVGLSTGTPVLIGLLIMHISALIFISAFFVATGKSFLLPFRSETKRFYVGAGFALAIGLGLIFLALDLSKVVIAIPLKSISPLFVLILSYMFLRDLERITKLLVFGSVLIVSGTVLIGSFM